VGPVNRVLDGGPDPVKGEGDEFFSKFKKNILLFQSKTLVPVGRTIAVPSDLSTSNVNTPLLPTVMCTRP